MTIREQSLVRALALMADQYLAKDGELDSQCMSAGESALEALAQCGLLETTDERRFGVWTEAGRRVLES